VNTKDRQERMMLLAAQLGETVSYLKRDEVLVLAYRRYEELLSAATDLAPNNEHEIERQVWRGILYYFGVPTS